MSMTISEPTRTMGDRWSEMSSGAKTAIIATPLVLLAVGVALASAGGNEPVGETAAQASQVQALPTADRPEITGGMEAPIDPSADPTAPIAEPTASPTQIPGGGTSTPLPTPTAPSVSSATPSSIPTPAPAATPSPSRTSTTTTPITAGRVSTPRSTPSWTPSRTTTTIPRTTGTTRRTTTPRTTTTQPRTTTSAPKTRTTTTIVPAPAPNDPAVNTGRIYVTPGDACSQKSANGIAQTGILMVCDSRNGSKLKWIAA